MPQSDPAALVLASSSRHRKKLLDRLGLEFTCFSPDIDESPLPDETAHALACRLAQAKARKLADRFDNAAIIGCDQVAVCEGRYLGKPGNYETALQQLQQAAGKEVLFLTSVCLLRVPDGFCQIETVPCRAVFRKLSQDTLASYLQREQPFDCAAAFQSEGLGIALLERLDCEDPTALIGLPLMRLCRMLEKAGIAVL